MLDDGLLGEAGDRVAFLTLPKARSVTDVQRFQETVQDHALRCGLQRTIPLSILIETPGAVHDAWMIAAVPGVVSLDFGTLDFVSSHYGAIPATAT